MEHLNGITFPRFDTWCALKANVEEDVLAQAKSLCDHFDALYNRFDKNSALSHLNAAAGTWIEVEPELADALIAARNYGELTQGLFDVTVGGICELWNFKQGIVPPEEEVIAACSHVDWRVIQIQGTRVRIADPLTTIDLGGLAKGIIADHLVHFLVDQGATSGYVNLGGNVVVIGAKPDGQPWCVGLRTPVPSDDPFQSPTFASVATCDKSVVTSGIFERAFAYDGHLMHHVLHPQTGCPAITDVLSATVISNKSADGDGFATALVIMGSKAALALAEARPELEAILFTSEGKILHTSGLIKDRDNLFHVLF